MSTIHEQLVIPGSLLLLTLMLTMIGPTEAQANGTSANGHHNATTTSAPVNYLETGRQITNILDRFMSLGYDKRVRPNYGGPPVEVNVTMRILSISSVSEVMMDFTADFYFRQTWLDPRLAFKKLENVKTLYVGAEVSKKIWLPDTFFGNEKLAYFHEATTPNVFLRIEYWGQVYRSIRLTVTSSCPMNLQYFPMDRQRCTIEAESYGYNVRDIIYRWAHSKAVERDEKISLPQFDIVKVVQAYRLEELTSGTYSRLVAEIHFARRMGYYLIQIYIPSSLIVVISWVSFWLHRNASPARVQLGVTTVLTMTTLMSSTNAALPKISYVKSIDIFLGTCFVMVFAALLEYATVGYLGKRIAMRKAQAQHAQSQAQARIFAQLQAQGAQGDPVPLATPASNGLGGNGPNLFGNHSFGSESQQQAAAAAAAAADQQHQAITAAVGQQPSPLMFLAAAAAATADPTSLIGAHAMKQQQQQQLLINEQATCHHCAAPSAVCVHHLQQQPKQLLCPHHHNHSHSHSLGQHGHHQHHHNHGHHQHHQSCRGKCRQHQQQQLDDDAEAGRPPTPPARSFASNGQLKCQCAGPMGGSQTLPRNITFAQTSTSPDEPCQHHQNSRPPALNCAGGLSCGHAHAHNYNHNHYNQQQQCNGKPLAPQHSVAGQFVAGGSPGSSSNKAVQAAATAAAATFVNLHRRNRGLPPSANPNFAQFAHLAGPYNRQLETIFGIRPSDIDKYSRVVFPVCFVCFQLMYWIVYLHISAFLESEQQQQQQQQPIA